MKIGIVGLGLIGGSFGRTAVKAGHEVFGEDRQEAVLIKAEMLCAITGRLSEASSKNLDLLISAVNPSDFESSVEKYLPHLKSGAVVMDFCGTKRGVVSAMKRLSEKYGGLTFIGGHPMAGREFSGIEHSSATLFHKASMILVPVKGDIFALDGIKKLFLSLGFGEAVITTAENHDRMIAFTSQECHVVSNAFVKSPRAKEHFGYSAGSYKDMTRVARLSPAMWTELMLENADYLAEELDILVENLQKYSAAIKRGDKKELFDLLAEGNEIKLAIDVNKAK